MKRMIAIIFVSLLPLACDHTESLLQNLSVMVNPHERWQSLRLSNYSIEQEHLCFCRAPHWYKVIVKNRRVSEVLGLNGEKLTLTSEIMSVEQIFDWIEKLRAQHPEKLEVNYNPEHGYPERILFGYSANTANGEFTLALRNLKHEP